jgi:hypothetical protein
MNITNKELEAIEKVVSYLYADEERNYEESEEDERTSHIFNSLKIIENVVNEYKNSSVIKQTKEILERFGITPTQESIEAAMRYDQNNLVVNLENAAISHFEILKKAIIK